MCDYSRGSLIAWNEYNDENHGYRGDQGREVMHAFRAGFDAGNTQALLNTAEKIDEAANPDQLWQVADSLRADAAAAAQGEKP